MSRLKMANIIFTLFSEQPDAQLMLEISKLSTAEMETLIGASHE
jgi:hypothetical protein